jgi:hypothetical protein
MNPKLWREIHLSDHPHYFPPLHKEQRFYVQACDTHFEHYFAFSLKDSTQRQQNHKEENRNQMQGQWCCFRKRGYELHSWHGLELFGELLIPLSDDNVKLKSSYSCAVLLPQAHSSWFLQQSSISDTFYRNDEAD